MYCWWSNASFEKAENETLKPIVPNVRAFQEERRNCKAAQLCQTHAF
jgi:hypothetical protein